ncbi:MAG: preprotein translocase subunit SecG [Acidobacteria bacterium]|nr:MAG: preprotein translocase subunit SecG [Acidobacteriota bacterium]
MILILLYVVHVTVSLFLIAVVLLQQGKGADLSVFGGGGTMTAFGARGAATMLHKLTVISFILFIVTTMSIGTLQRSGSSVMSDLPSDESPAVATEVDDEAAAPAEAGDAAGDDGAGSSAPGAVESDEPAPAGDEPPAGGDEGGS